MPRSPNAEQKLAIEHQGGVLLRAGAGSGKTFVLVEHIVYLTKSWMDEFLKLKQSSFEEFLRSKYSQVVMMTFTKKAAGEMSIRLTEKFEEMAEEEGPHQELWRVANELLPILMVTTIDGFCKKLISLGYFPHLSTETKIIFDTERSDQVDEILEEWFLERSHAIAPEILDIVVKEKRHILNAFTGIFSDPGLRLQWKKFDLKAISPESLNKILQDSFKLNELENALGPVHSLTLPAEEKKWNAFEKVVALFQASGLPVVEKRENLSTYIQLFESVSRIDNRNKDFSYVAAKEGLVELRDWVKKWKDVVADFELHFEDKILPWMKMNLDIFHFIESRLDPNQGMTFGDIEYFVSLGLENREDLQRIQKNFSYFIVDEFQDTSDIQFQIIRNLLGGNFSKLFCVGDAKQAIYGFRGGELSVFQDCAGLVPVVRSLANNYRSLPEVINFNNSLFRAILPLGYNFSGHDPFTVLAEDQNIPPEVQAPESGEILIHEATLSRDLDTEGKFSTDEINRIEATLLAEAITLERRTTSNVCTVLYSKLKPSSELIRALMQRKMGFTAQFKIDLMDDPILGIFVTLLRRLFDSNKSTRERYPLFILESYFKVLCVEPQIDQSHLAQFEEDMKYWGMVEAFRKFLFKLHITNENADINLETIETIVELYHQDPEGIMNQLLKGQNDRLSLELRSGAESHKVQIMSAHASKGLEFDSVYLGGVFTNGKSLADRDLLGDLPGSFSWYKDLSTREKQKSPLYVFENELSRLKDYSEAKRLFYVACTRAKKKLSWVELHLPEKTFSIPANSWILGLRAWMENSSSIQMVRVVPSSFDFTESLKAKSRQELPLFFHDPVGIYSKGEGDSELLIAAELSVTRLNSLVDCPRKFYLGNVLKMSEPESEKKIFVETESTELADVIRSSSERGTLIHEKISQGVARNFVVPRESFNQAEKKAISFALELLKEKANDFELISEKQIKFPLFNFMISGIPDLVLMSKGDKNSQVWDFKTGRITQENLGHYWIQLQTYAYALYELGKIPKTQAVELVLCFVDQEQLIQETTNWEHSQSVLYPLWRSQNEPWKTNPDHCTQCIYGSICPR